MLAAGKAEKELAQSEVADGGGAGTFLFLPLSSILFLLPFCSPHPPLEGLLTGSQVD